MGGGRAEGERKQRRREGVKKDGVTKAEKELSRGE